VSVVTPTWQRHEYLLDRCVPSVQAQTWPGVEHVVVSDGPDLELKLAMALQFPDARYEEMPDGPGGHWGHVARLHAIAISTGDLITYLDDDDAFRPDHCQVLAEALIAHPEADFAYSLMSSQGAVIGQDPPAYCQIGVPMIMHRRELLERGTWERSMPSIDWDLVERWLAAGARYVHVPQVTIDVWPSAYR
jgi:glycosyltransferase involved in cell wall biosynthesis